MFRTLARLQARFPVATSLSTGAGIMSIGDAVVQVAGGSFDPTRNAVVSSFSGATSPAWGAVFGKLDRLWPGTSAAVVARKAVTTQVISPASTAMFFAWSMAADALLRGSAAPSSEEGLGTRVLDRVLSEVPNMFLTGSFFWIPVNGLNFMLVPSHMRVAFMYSSSVMWGAYMSYVAYRS